ncbi:hypothetical protein CASFOL_040515 [Castilleja foliolosa]|uniref:Uncharacterized protein n=1 Tax=Castilleja foliolosa TaxID=1961234 RepID=A0ABD3BCG5_9LAMI
MASYLHLGSFFVLRFLHRPYEQTKPFKRVPSSFLRSDSKTM